MDSTSSHTFLTRRNFLAAAFIGTATLFLSATPIEAFAATKWSASRSVTRNGATFTYLSGLDATKTPTAYTKITASKSVPAGAMKAKALIVQGLNGNVLVASAPLPNKSAGKSLTASVTLSKPVLGHRSRGKVSIYNSQWLPCESTAIGYSLAPELPVNEHGQTLGTYEDVERGAVPDLVGIVADSGIDGYAYWEQFDAEDAPDAIPVYAEDGTTQIGIFTFGDK